MRLESGRGLNNYLGKSEVRGLNNVIRKNMVRGLKRIR